MTIVYERRMLMPVWIFDPKDEFLAGRRLPGDAPRPLARLRYSLISQPRNGGAETFAKPLEMRIRSNSDGYALFFGQILAKRRRSNRHCEFRNMALAEGAYRVKITSSYYQAVVLPPLQIPHGNPIPIELRPSYAYPFPAQSALPGGLGVTTLRGALHATDGSGIAGATVDDSEDPEKIRYITDSSGQWVLIYPDGVAFGERVIQFSIPPVGEIVRIKKNIKQRHVTSLLQKALRGVVYYRGAPARGATVKVLGRSGQTETQTDGSWSYFFRIDESPDSVNVRAMLPDGTEQIRSNVPVSLKQALIFRFE